MIYETITEQEDHHGEPTNASTIDISNSARNTCSLGMGATIQKIDRIGLWYGGNHTVDNTI